MSDEVMRILKLLENGKINSEEAEKLIGAVSNKKPHGFYVPNPPKIPKEFMIKMETIPEQIGQAVSAAFGSVGQSAGKKIFHGAKDIKLKVVSGQIDLKPSDSGVTIDGVAWPMRTMVEKELLIVDTVNADMIAGIPEGANATISLVSADLHAKKIIGEVKIEGVSSDIEIESCSGLWNIRSISGDVNIRGITGQIAVATKAGDIEVDISGKGGYLLKTIRGDIDIEVPKDIVVSLDVSSDEGKISIPEQLENAKNVNPEEADITISARSESGDINISIK